MSKKVIPDLYTKHIEGTESGAIVVDVKVFLCHITNSVMKGLQIPFNKVYVSSKVIKHLYDKKPAEEFVFLKDNLHSIVKYPDAVYENKSGKRAAMCFVKEIKSHHYICCIDLTETVVDGQSIQELHIVTAFRIRKEAYLDSYKLLWSWKDGSPSS